MEKGNTVVCVTGSAGFIGSLLVKKLLEKGYTVHATLRSLEDHPKVGLLKSLPNADANLILFQADLRNSVEFEAAIRGCQFVFHVATPMPQTNASSESARGGTVEATVAGVKSIAEACIRSQTVKRLIYTSSVVTASPLSEDGLTFKSFMDESCWTPFDKISSLTYSVDAMLEYTKSKTLGDIEASRHNSDGKLEVVNIACGVVGGETLLSYVPFSVGAVISQVTSEPWGYNHVVKFLEEMLGSVPIVHVDDVCEAHIFCMEKPSLSGRFLCAVASTTAREMAILYQENHPEYEINERFKGEQVTRLMCDLSKLVKLGFEYKYDIKMILRDSVECGKRVGALPHK